MDEIELKVHDMSSTLQPADAYALVLEEVNGNRKLPIIIGSLEAQAIKVVMMGYKMPRPLTHDLFLTVTKELGTALKKVLIYKVKDGVYYSYLFLEKEGMHVTNAEDGQQGVEYFSHSEEYYFDVILMDVRMPVMDGIEATKAIRGMARKDAATVPIIALSANTFDEDIEECKAAGMNGHMSKPIIPDEFYKVLQKAIPSP